MTPEQMKELAARLHTQAQFIRTLNTNGATRADDLDAAADLIEQMAQRVPLTTLQIILALDTAQVPRSSDGPEYELAVACAIEAAHAIRSDK